MGTPTPTYEAAKAAVLREEADRLDSQICDVYEWEDTPETNKDAHLAAFKRLLDLTCQLEEAWRNLDDL